MSVVDAALLFGADGRSSAQPATRPIEEAKPASVPESTRRPTSTPAIDLNSVRAQLEARLTFITDELERLDALDAERTKIERLLAAIGD